MLLAVVSFGLYAAAISFHAVIRIVLHDDSLGTVVDAGGLTLMTVGLTIAVLKVRLLDVEYYVDRALVFGFSAAILLLAFWLIEEYLGSPVVERITAIPALDQLGRWIRLTFHVVVRLSLSLLIGRVHHFAEETVRCFIFRDRDAAIAAIAGLEGRMGTFLDGGALEDELLTTVMERVKSSGVAIYRVAEGGRSVWRGRWAMPRGRPRPAAPLSMETIRRARGSSRPPASSPARSSCRWS